MSRTSGRTTVEAHAPVQAATVAVLEAAAWREMVDQRRLDLFDLATRAIARQHGLPPLRRPEALGPSPWTEEDARSWRTRATLADSDQAALRLAEQFAFDVASTQPSHREQLFTRFGANATSFAQAVYVADLLPRARAALDALFGPSEWSPRPALDDAGSEPVDLRALDAAIDDVIRLVPALQALDPVTTELVRLLGARRHDCRVCQSVRSYSAIEAGADDALFDAVDRYATSDYSDAHKAALAFVDGMISSPARFDVTTSEALRRRFEPEACVELVLDVLRNATNKIAVALGGDAPRVETGYEIYDVKPTGEIEYGLEAPASS